MIAVEVIPGSTARRRLDRRCPTRSCATSRSSRSGSSRCPHEVVPLHIFEERYRTMIGECLERGSRVRDRLGAPTTGRARSAARCEITEVLERMEDGRMNILTPRHAAVPDRRGAATTSPTRPATVEFLDDKDEKRRRRARPRPPTRPTPSSSSRRPTRTLEPDELDGDDRLRDGRDRRLRPRGQAGPARPALRERPPAARRRGCSAPRSSGWTSSSARRSGRARTGRSASAEEPGQPPLRAEPRAGEDQRRARRSPRRSSASPSRTTP